MFIVFEGIDGSGKTTQIRKVQKWLEERGKKAIIVREPGGTPVSEAIRNILLSKSELDIVPATEALLFAASRAQLVQKVIRPALKRGEVVLCDRFIHSTLAYQGYARNFLQFAEDCVRLGAGGLRADIVFYLRIGIPMMKKRTKLKPLDRMEKEGDNFYTAVINGYDTLAKRFPETKTINGERSHDEVFDEIVNHLSKLFP